MKHFEKQMRQKFHKNAKTQQYKYLLFIGTLYICIDCATLENILWIKYEKYLEI